MFIAFLLHTQRCIAHTQPHVVQRITRNRRVIYADAFFKVDDIRAGEQSCFVAGTAQNSMDVGSGRAFAIRARNMHKAKLLLRVS